MKPRNVARDGNYPARANGWDYQRIRYLIFIFFVVACCAGGGGSRGDIFSLLYLRPLTAACLIAIVALPGDLNLRSVRMPLTLLSALTLWILLQLVPLPPSLWTSLPGREAFEPGAPILGFPQPWRPISLSPDLTVNSLASMIVPFAALIGFAALTDQRRKDVIPILVVAVGIGCLLGIAQISSGPNSPFHLYRVTNSIGAVGLFANRNHQAIMLAMAFPMLAVWAMSLGVDRRMAGMKQIVLLIIALILFVMILVTGSRTGLAVGVIGAIWAIASYLERRRNRRGDASKRWLSLGIAIAATAMTVVLLAFITYSRAETVHRLANEQFASEQRTSYLPYFIEMIRDYFPVGSGMGTFDPVFRVREPFELLVPTYLNHAHNDLVELVITGGLPALLILVLFVSWFLWKSVGAFLDGKNQREQRIYSQLGAVWIFILLAASLVDYPLRTPTLALMFAIACVWLSGPGADSERREPALRSSD